MFTFIRFVVLILLSLCFLIGVPHYVASLKVVPDLQLSQVNLFFYIFNNLSIVYVIVPFFGIELIRYIYHKRLSRDLILDSFSNVLTIAAFQMIQYVLGWLFIFKLYALASQNAFLSELPLNWVTIVSCILLADFLYYWEHRLMHRVGLGWATHTVHHSSPYFNMSVAYRFGPLDWLFPLLFSVPAVLFGFHPLLLLACEIFVQTFQAILHTEIIGKLPRPIEFIFNTPSHHRVHHGSNRQYWDKNYAGILIIWDRMFDTFALEEEEVVYGISEPLNSVNPIKVFFHGLTRLRTKMRRTSGMYNKLLCLFKPPEWESEAEQPTSFDPNASSTTQTPESI